MTNYTDILRQIGLSKNEARIYETLLREGESSVGHIATESKVHRRNVYDSLNRLLEKGLVFEIMSGREGRYQAVEPKKLSDLLDEQKGVLNEILPNLESLYKEKPTEYSVYTYRGVEGWKNYMRDILRVGEDVYVTGAIGAWLDPRVKDFFPYFAKELNKKKIKLNHIFDHRMKLECPEIIDFTRSSHSGAYKFFPKGFITPSAVDVFGDHVNILTNVGIRDAGNPIEFTVIKNKHVADSFRTWFQFMWDMLPEEK